MNDNELEQRLRAIGTRPLDPETRHIHHSRIDAASAARRGSRRFGAVALVAAGVVGFLAGSTGLAMAGALPDSAQDVAHDVLGVVQVDVPPGKRGPCVSQAAKIKDKAEKQAAKDACPKGSSEGEGEGDDVDDTDAVDEGGAGSTDAPGRSGDAPGHTGENPGHSGDAPGRTGDVPRGNGAGAGKHTGDPCRGRPVWAGPMTPEQRAALHEANSREDCANDSDPDDTAEISTTIDDTTVDDTTVDDSG